MSWGCLIYNPSYEVLRKTLPKKFHFIDCTEVFIETPSDPALKAATWSDYKHHHTTRILVSITPNGPFNVVSKAWGGRTSDVDDTRESGFYDIFEKHDEVMADRGFTIADDLLLQHAKLHIPPGKRGQEQFSKSEVKKTKEIANLRIYVEQAIRRLKTFHIICWATWTILLLFVLQFVIYTNHYVSHDTGQQTMCIPMNENRVRLFLK